MSGYFKDGTISVELGEHAFWVPAGLRRNVTLDPIGRVARVLDSGGGTLELAVTGQALRANLGDAERYIYEHLRALAASDPGELGAEDHLARQVTAGQAVCVAASGEVHAFRFAEVRYEFAAPSASSAPAWSSVPSAPGTYAGTSTAQDYAVSGGIALGTHRSGMRIEMQRHHPLREIPRARGARARGPAGGAVIRFTVSSHAVADGAEHLARYLDDLRQQIGPRPVDLTANGNTYRGVLLEALRPRHTDSVHAEFEAEFLMEA